MPKVNSPHSDDIYMDTDVLRYIIAIVDEHSLSRAAERMYMAQPALSRYLRRVETALGTPIFIREHNQLRLTESGIIFINAARSIVQLEKQCDHQLRQLRKEQQMATRGVSLMVQDVFTPIISEIIVPIWESRHPELPLNIRTGNGDQMRASIPLGQSELYLMLGSSADTKNYDTYVLGKSPMIMHSPRVELPEGTWYGEFALGALLDSSPFLMVSHDMWLRKRQEQILQSHGISRPHIVAEAELQVLLDLLPLGHGYTLLPLLALRTKDRDTCQRLSEEYDCECLLVRQKTVALTPLCQMLIDLFKEYAPQLPGVFTNWHEL